MIANGEAAETDYAAFEGSSEGATVADIPGFADAQNEATEESIEEDVVEEEPVPAKKGGLKKGGLAKKGIGIWSEERRPRQKRCIGIWSQEIRRNRDQEGR